MATSDFSTAKTICILAIVVGCFAILWPKVFYPMMQAAFTMTKPRLNDEQGEPINYPTLPAPVCCDVIYESKIDLKFFAELCKSVINREMATDPGIRKYRKERYPPPGMMERCRKKILELCDIDISEALVKSKKGKISIDLRKSSNDSQQELQPQKLNLTECLEKHFHLSRPLTRRAMKETTALPSHIRQERPSHMGPQMPHPSLMERGNPFHHKVSDRVVTHPGKVNPGGSLRPTLKDPGKAGPSGKGGGAMGFVMPIYTVGIIVFFLYTITKVLFRRPDDKAAKVMDFHMDPEYRKYVLSEEYGNGVPLSYKDYLKKKETEENAAKKAKLLSEKGRKQVFTAIEGIIAEMDDFRDRLMAEQSLQKSTDIEDESITTSDDESKTRSEMEPAYIEKDIEIPEDNLDERISKLEEPLNQLAEQLKIITGDSKLAVLGIDTQADFHEKQNKPEATEVSNIILETSVPCDTQLLVAESQCLTHTSTDRIEGWSDYEEQPVVVTGKMTISLLGKEASVHSTESKTSKRPTAPSRLSSNNEVDQRKNSSKERQKIEELANALVEDILHKQVPKIFEAAANNKGNVSPDMDTFEMLSGSAVPRREISFKSRVSPRRQFSRESLNSQGSSFEYVSACQDEPLTPKAEEGPRFGFPSPAESDNAEFEVIKNGNSFHQNGGSPISFECISAGSVSPLSPELETGFEKIRISDGNGIHCELNGSASPGVYHHEKVTRISDSDSGVRDSRLNDVTFRESIAEVEDGQSMLTDSADITHNLSTKLETDSLLDETEHSAGLVASGSDFSCPSRDTSSEQSSADSVVSVTEVCRPETDGEYPGEKVAKESIENDTQ